MVERPLRMREAWGSMPHFSKYFLLFFFVLTNSMVCPFCMFGIIKSKRLDGNCGGSSAFSMGIDALLLQIILFYIFYLNKQQCNGLSICALSYDHRRFDGEYLYSIQKLWSDYDVRCKYELKGSRPIMSFDLFLWWISRCGRRMCKI